MQSECHPQGGVLPWARPNAHAHTHTHTYTHTHTHRLEQKQKHFYTFISPTFRLRCLSPSYCPTFAVALSCSYCKTVALLLTGLCQYLLSPHHHYYLFIILPSFSLHLQYRRKKAHYSGVKVVSEKLRRTAKTSFLWVPVLCCTANLTVSFIGVIKDAASSTHHQSSSQFTSPDNITHW